jgi:hypothetical protein
VTLGFFLLARNLVTLCFGHEPKARVATKPNNGCYFFPLTRVVIGIFEYLIIGSFLVHYNQEQKKKLALKPSCFSLVHEKLYCQGENQVLRRYFEDLKIPTMLQEMHEGVGGGHFSSEITICKFVDAN